MKYRIGLLIACFVLCVGFGLSFPRAASTWVAKLEVYELVNRTISMTNKLSRRDTTLFFAIFGIRAYSADMNPLYLGGSQLLDAYHRDEGVRSSTGGFRFRRLP